MPVSQPPLVSICVPTYNSSAWLRETIESALGQSFTDFELVISDNASADSTLEILHSYRDSRIRLEPSERNIGLTLNHNRLIRLSKGRYVKFLHADDALAPTCLEEMVALALEDDRIGLVFAPRENVIYDENGNEWLRTITRDHETPRTTREDQRGKGSVPPHAPGRDGAQLDRRAFCRPREPRGIRAMRSVQPIHPSDDRSGALGSA